MLYTKENDSNNNFYLKELSKLSASKRGKYRFSMIHYNQEFEKELYVVLFKEFSDNPKFAVIKGDNVEILEKFPEKNNFYKDIEYFVNSFEFKELKGEYEILKIKEIRKNEKVEDNEEQSLNKEEIN